MSIEEFNKIFHSEKKTDGLMASLVYLARSGNSDEALPGQNQIRKSPRRPLDDDFPGETWAPWDA